MCTVFIDDVIFLYILIFSYSMHTECVSAWLYMMKAHFLSPSSKKNTTSLSLACTCPAVCSLAGLSSADLSFRGRAIKALPSKQGVENGLLSFHYCLLIQHSFLPWWSGGWNLVRAVCVCVCQAFILTFTLTLEIHKFTCRDTNWSGFQNAAQNISCEVFMLLYFSIVM